MFDNIKGRMYGNQLFFWGRTAIDGDFHHFKVTGPNSLETKCGCQFIFDEKAKASDLLMATAEHEIAINSSYICGDCL